MNVTIKQVEEAFTEWDRRYRENPEDFEDIAVSLLKGNPETYGQSAAPYFVYIIKELKKENKNDV